MFSAQAGGINLSIQQQIIMMLTLMLTSKGVAGVPRASLVVLSGALQNFGLPLEAVALILGVDAVMDMARTSVNLLGNCLATCVVAKWEREFRGDIWMEEQHARQTAAFNGSSNDVTISLVSEDKSEHMLDGLDIKSSHHANSPV